MLSPVLALAASFALASAVTITDIQGPAFRSPFEGKTVTDVVGIVTAKSTSGFWIQGDAVSDDRVSNGLNVFTTSTTILDKVAIGDSVTVSGKINEFRTTGSGDLFGTEIEPSSSSDVVVGKKGNTVTPLVLGVDRSPPTQSLSALDVGPDGFLSVPNNQSLVESVNATLQPTEFGLDFWESLEGQLVTVKSPTVTDFENDFGEFWVYGDWPVTGQNSRGGLTMIFGPNGVPDANPEVVIIGQPLDGTKSPQVAVGQKFEDITGVVFQQFGFFYVMPLTAPKLASSPSFVAPVTNITASSGACQVTIGDYNIDNMAPNSTTLPQVAGHIGTNLKGPDIMFVQEIQDSSGPTDNGVVDANLTMQTMASAIMTASGVEYTFIDIPPVNDQDGGEPGGNIRQVYFYRPDIVKLAGTSPVGTALESTSVITESDGSLGLSLNPGRIDPTNSAWDDSRKPLVAVWEPVAEGGERFFTINLHLIAKTGGTSFEGDSRPPVNEGIQQRTAQVTEVANFVKTILAKNENANIIVGGDCNEFTMTRSVFAPFDDILTEVDVLANIPDVERYTYVFDQQNEQLDHLFVSSAIAGRTVQVQHVHVNQFAETIDDRGSDHDPSIAKLEIC
ncbi:DNase I-like protein [Schizopora paradoxa]|uniref:DNase I-like protein n=1 Tax=Schizopora paradoxa TaxID=27342 RepID=A0A0H2R8E1_9AGAM|nr:DNase I-like protein [Schizopora paradoxa]